VRTRRWYQRIAPIYDLICKPLYSRPRQAGLRALDLTLGQSVLDLCTGTGLNLVGLAAAVGPTGQVIGLDFCPSMLARASLRVQRKNLGQVQLLETDVSLWSQHLLQSQCGLAQVDAILCSFGLAVAPDWRTLFQQSWKLLRPGGKYVIVDNRPIPAGLLRSINPLLVPISNFCGCAQIQRPTWQLLHGGANSTLRPFLGGYVFVASAQKPPPGNNA
jgi:ubiquinone/menaquinone biosynthesis C-methylase UbiE